MTKVLSVLVGLVLLAATSAGAQTVNADRFNLKAQDPNCLLRTGTGVPGTLGACDIVVDVNTGAVHVAGLGSSPTKNGGDLFVSPSRNLLLSPGGDAWLSPALDVIINPGIAGGREVLPAVAYSTSLGTFNRKFLTLHAAELQVETLVARETLATIGGRIVVAPTTTLARDLPPNATQIYTKHNSFRLHVANLHLGSHLILEGDGKFEVMVVYDLGRPTPQPDGSYMWNVGRDQDGSGPPGGNQWFAGDAILDTGVQGDGFVDIYSLRRIASSVCQEHGNCPPATDSPSNATFGPSIVGNVRYMYSPWYAYEERWALGNLNGVFGFTTNTYGAAFGKPDGARLILEPTQINMYAGAGTNGGRLNMAANGITLYAGNGAPAIVLYADGRATFQGAHYGDGDNITNIRGGHIQTDTITATQIATDTITSSEIAAKTILADDIASNTITVGELIATGFGDNLIKNGTFEGLTHPEAMAGWIQDMRNNDAYRPVKSCCGLNGPGTMFLSAGVGGYLSATYKASPVVAGQTYRVSLKVFANTYTGGGFYVRMQEHTTTSPAPAHRIILQAQAPPLPYDYGATGVTDVIGNGALNAGWTPFEFVYTVPGGVTWVSLGILNYTGISGTYTDLHIDDVEMQKQIGGGHIRANSIHADRIEANTITGTQIYGDSLDVISANMGTITSGTINSVTINSATINSATLNSNVINGAYISGTTIAGGVIDGATIYAGWGNVALNSAGLSLAGGYGAENRIKWTDGSQIWSHGDGVLYVWANYVVLGGPNNSLPVQVYNPLAAHQGVTAAWFGADNLRNYGNTHVCTNNDGGLYACGAQGLDPQVARMMALEDRLARLEAALALATKGSQQ